MVEPKADQGPGSTFHFAPFHCSLSVALQLDKGDYPEDSRVLFCDNSVLFNLLCVWVLFQNASSHSCLRLLFLYIFLIPHYSVIAGNLGRLTRVRQQQQPQAERNPFLAVRAVLSCALANTGMAVQVQCCFTSTETILRTIWDREPRTATSIFTQFLSSEILQFNVALRPQRPYGPLGTRSPGRPPRLSHSS